MIVEFLYDLASVTFVLCKGFFVHYQLRRIITKVILLLLSVSDFYHVHVPASSPSCGGEVTVYVWHKPTELAHSFIFCSCVYYCLYGPFNCISFHQFYQQLSVFWLCSSGLMFALLVLSILYLFMKVSFSPDIIPSGRLGSKHQLTN